MTITVHAETRTDLIKTLADLLAFKRRSISDNVRNILYQRQKGRCTDCGERLILIGPAPCHSDHIIPLARGGSDDIRNLQLLCAPCNLRKGSRDPIEHARKLGRLL